VARPALSATRAIEVVNFLAAHPADSFTLSDLVDRLDINVASLHALLATLTDSGYLSRHPRHRTYTLGPALVAVGTAALEQHPAIEIAREEAASLSARLDLDVAITARAGDDVVFVARAGEHHPRGVPTHVGQRMPLRPPMGSVFYAWAEPVDVEAWLAQVPEAARELDRAELTAVAARGFSVALDSPIRIELGVALEALAERPDVERRDRVDRLVAELGRSTNHLTTIDRDATYAVSSITGPVFDANGAVVLAVNFIGFGPSLTGADVLSLGAEARDAGLVVSKRTRGEPPAVLRAREPADGTRART
jgi:DNA-binding IclR family transcriptional regulator